MLQNWVQHPITSVLILHYKAREEESLVKNFRQRKGNRMQKIKGWYENNTEKIRYPIAISNDGRSLSFMLKGVPFITQYFPFELDQCQSIPADLNQRFDIWEQRLISGSTDYILCNCTIALTFPQTVVAVNAMKIVESQLEIRQYLGAVNPNLQGHFKLTAYQLEACLIIESKTYYAQGEDFEALLGELVRQLNSQYFLKNCFGCLYSDYSVYGHSEFGTMRCYKNTKEQYLNVKNKQDYIMLESSYDQVVQETFCCPDFKKRVKVDPVYGTGYRG